MLALSLSLSLSLHPHACCCHLRPASQSSGSWSGWLAHTGFLGGSPSWFLRRKRWISCPQVAPSLCGGWWSCHSDKEYKIVWLKGIHQLHLNQWFLSRVSSNNVFWGITSFSSYGIVLSVHVSIPCRMTKITPYFLEDQEALFNPNLSIHVVVTCKPKPFTHIR